VVNGVNIKVLSGQIIGLIGRNGAGKTTTFQMIAGLIKPNEGTITLNDLNISQYSTHQRAKKGNHLPSTGKFCFSQNIRRKKS